MSYNEVVQAIADAQTDAQTLEDVVNGAPDTQVKSRLGRKIWTLATINSKIDYVRTQADAAVATVQSTANNATSIINNNASSSQELLNKKLAELDSAIAQALAAGAGANGWTTDLVVENGLTQKQINSRTDYVNALDYLTKAEIDDLSTATPVLDHTKSLQKAIDASIALGKKLFIPRMTGAYNIKIEPDEWTALPNDRPASGVIVGKYRSGLVFKENAYVEFAPNTKLQAMTTDAWSCYGFTIVGDNVTIKGNGTLFMGERLTHKYNSVKIPASKTTSEGVVGCIISAANVTLEGMQFKDWTGDCIAVVSYYSLYTGDYVNPAPKPTPRYSKYVTIKNCVVDGARRNNISVIDCDGFLIDNCLVVRAGYTDANGTLGTNPKLGIDLEPYKTGNPADGYDTAEVVQNGTVSNCRFIENRVGDVTAYNVYNVKIVNNHCTATINNGSSNNTVIANNVVDMSIARANSSSGDGKGTGITSLGTPNSDRFNHANNSLITGNILYGCTKGIDVRGSKNKVSNNVMVNCNDGINCFGALDLIVEDNYVLSPTAQGIAITSGLSTSTEKSLITVRGNTIQDFSGSGKAVFVEAKAETTLLASDNILNNCARGMEIKGAGLYHVSVTGNTFNKVQQTYVGQNAVLVVEAATKNCIIENNTFTESLSFYNPISIKGRAIVRANKFLDCTANNLIAITASNTRVIDNVFEFNGTANGGRGIFTASTANNVVFMGNRFFSASGYNFDADIVTYDSTNNTIADNFISSRIQSGTTDIVHGNVVMGKAYKVTSTYDPPSLATNAQQSTTVTLTGATVGETVSVSFDKPLQGTRMWAEVTSTNTVTIYHRNDTGVTVDLASGTLTVKIV